MFNTVFLAWVLSTSNVAVNLDHVAAVKVVPHVSPVAGQVYQVRTVPAVGTTVYTLAVFPSSQEAYDYIEHLLEQQ